MAEGDFVATWILYSSGLGLILRWIYVPNYSTYDKMKPPLSGLACLIKDESQLHGTYPTMFVWTIQDLFGTFRKEEEEELTSNTEKHIN